MRLTVGGIFVYSGTALMLFVQSVRLVLTERLWVEGVSVAPVCLVVVTAAAALLFGTGALFRQPLIEGAGDLARESLAEPSEPGRGVGPWFNSMGWAAVIALTAVGMAIALMTSYDEVIGLWLTGPAVFVPFWVRKLEESYRDGVDEARRGR